jgi:hypothetical protein
MQEAERWQGGEETVPFRPIYFVGFVALAIIGVAIARWLNPRMRLLAGAALLSAVVTFMASTGCPSNQRTPTGGVVAPDRSPPPPPSSPEGIKRVPAPAQ